MRVLLKIKQFIKRQALKVVDKVLERSFLLTSQEHILNRELLAKVRPYVGELQQIKRTTVSMQWLFPSTELYFLLADIVTVMLELMADIDCVFSNVRRFLSTQVNVSLKLLDSATSHPAGIIRANFITHFS